MPISLFLAFLCFLLITNKTNNCVFATRCQQRQQKKHNSSSSEPEMNMILYVDCIIIIIVIIILHGTYVQCTLVQLCKQFSVFQNSRSTNSENNFHNVVFVLGSLSLSRYSRQTILPPEAMVQKQPCRWRRKKQTFFVTSTNY